MDDDLKSFGQKFKKICWWKLIIYWSKKDFKSLAKYYEKLTLPRLSTVRKGKS